MGTSNSYGGPTKNQPTPLPRWPEPSFPTPAVPDSPPSPDRPPDGKPDLSSKPAPGPEETSPVQPPVGQTLSWRGPKGGLSRYAAGGGRPSLKKAGGSYVGAHGGARRAAATAVSGRTATQRMGGFLSSVATVGIRKAFESLGLGRLVGKNAEEVLSAICDAIAPEGATLEEAIARAATSDVLAALYEKYGLEDGIEKLDSMDKAAVEEMVVLSVEAYIFERWLQELGKSLEKHATSADEACRLERDIRAYVKEEVKLQLDGLDVMSVDWSNPQTREVIEGIYETAYDCLETNA